MTVSLSICSASNCACLGVAPPFPPTYKFHPPSTAIIPKSFPLASAHSRIHPETPPFILCGEDVICLVFLEFYFEPFAKKYTEDKMIDIVQKTWRKMSEEGHEAALKLPLSEVSLSLVAILNIQPDP